MSKKDRIKIVVAETLHSLKRNPIILDEYIGHIIVNMVEKTVLSVMDCITDDRYKAKTVRTVFNFVTLRFPDGEKQTLEALKILQKLNQTI